MNTAQRRQAQIAPNVVNGLRLYTRVSVAIVKFTVQTGIYILLRNAVNLKLETQVDST